MGKELEKGRPVFLSDKLFQKLSFTAEATQTFSNLIYWEERFSHLLGESHSNHPNNYQGEQFEGNIEEILPEIPPVVPGQEVKYKIWYHLQLDFNFEISLFVEELNSQKFFKLNRHTHLNSASLMKEISAEDLSWLAYFSDIDYGDGADYLQVFLPSNLDIVLLKALAQTGRLFIGERTVVTFDDDGQYFFNLSVQKNENNEESTNEEREWKVWGHFCSSGLVDSPKSLGLPKIDLWNVSLASASGLFLINERLCRFCNSETFPLIDLLQSGGPLFLPKLELGKFFKQLLGRWGKIPLLLSDKIKINTHYSTPSPILYLKSKSKIFTEMSDIHGLVCFKYFNSEFPGINHQEGTKDSPIKYDYRYDTKADLFLINLFYRNYDLENGLWQNIEQSDMAKFNFASKIFKFQPFKLMRLVYLLLENGWNVWAENLQIKILKDFIVDITTQNSWLEISLSIGNSASSFSKISAWQLVHMLKKRKLFIQLDDGTMGVLPEVWFDQLQALSSFGMVDSESDAWKFSKASALQLEGLEDNSHLRTDHYYRQICNELHNISGVIPKMPSATFTGILRGYQQYGLGWLHFLDQTGLGGCLADEMGLGKTVQVLAFLEDLRLDGEKRNDKKPATILIVPKSLLGNWQQEASKFAPYLKTMAIHRQHLPAIAQLIGEYDLLITSYGLIRNNMATLGKHLFNYIILDEAQIIKNSKTQIASAVKFLNGKNRLCLSGTPIENHIGDLFSLFDFLNPGLISPEFYRLTQVQNDNRIKMFFSGIRPLVLKRLKAEVIPDLPEKFEQELSLPLIPEQKEMYDNIKLYYQQQLSEKGDEKSFLQYKIFFLEGLMRLRQASCHPQLLSHAYHSPQKSNKVIFLLEKIQTLIESGHKALIFSQFTSFLKIIGHCLDELKLPYEYLDGHSQDRGQIVANFQENDNVQLFLISLKAGGLGLNLTAADYCFVLDPWWNPAVEKQAVDRIHRIGQQKNVFVYKLLSQNSVEEKIKELHKYKLNQADLLGSSDEAFLDKLTFEDFKYLFE